MEKPAECVSCGNALEQPETGRPRVYCGVPCRRAAEYELRRVQSQLGMAEKAEIRARESVVTARSWGSDTDSARKLVKFWAGEVSRLRGRQRALLAGTGDD